MKFTKLFYFFVFYFITVDGQAQSFLLLEDLDERIAYTRRFHFS
jgi:hypothetical protein